MFTTIVVKAAFGPAGQLLGDCDPICQRDVHRDKDPTKSLLDCTDLVPYLGTGEVHFHGAAYVPSGGRVQARLSVVRDGTSIVDKAIVANSPKGSAGGIVRVPVIHENALGGPGNPDNPVGHQQPLLIHGAQSAKPGALGPLAPIWRARSAVLGKSHQRPRTGKTMELQRGFPWGYFHAAPLDQRASDFFRGDETVRLEHLTPTSTVVELKLPGAHVEARLPRNGRSALSLGFNADVLRVDGERLRTTICWRGFFETPPGDRECVVTVGIAMPGQQVSWPPAAKVRTVELSAPKTDVSSAGAPIGAELGETAAPEPEVELDSTLPFAEPNAAKQPSSKPPAIPLPGAPWGAPVVRASGSTPLGTTMDVPSAHDRAEPAVHAPVVRSPVAAMPVPAMPVPAMPVPAMPVPAMPVPAMPVPAMPVAAMPVPPVSPSPRPPETVELVGGLGTDLLIAVASRRRGAT